MKPHFPLLLILALATVLRLIAVFKYGDFWDDEMFNFIYSQKSWPQGFIYWLWETNPPLHLLILKIWFYFFPAIEFFARLPSVLAGVASVYAIYRFGCEIFNKKTAYIAAFYLAVHSYNIFWSATSRVYAIFMLLVLCSSWFFYRIFFTDTGKHGRKKLAIINLLLIFAHLSSLFFLAGQFIALLAIKGKASVIEWIKINIFPFIAGFIWISASFIIKSGNNLGQAWFLNMSHSIRSSVNPLINMFFGLYPLIAGAILVGAAILALLLMMIKKISAKDTLYLLLIIIATTPIIFSFACNVWHIKFFISALPLFVLALAEAISVKIKFIPALILILLICFTGLYRLFFILPLTDWNNVREYFVSHDNGINTVLIYNNYIHKSQIDRYLPGNISNRSIPLLLYENISWDNMVVKKNYLFSSLDEEKKDDWYEHNKLNDYARIILLQGEYSYMNKLNRILEKNGWEIVDGPKRARVSGSYNLYYYEKN